MGDRQRFREFASLIAAHTAPTSRIADVAGGKGLLQAALRARDFNRIVSFDKRKGMAKPHRQEFYRYKWFSYNEQEAFDAVAAMHPDEGTDHAILYAVKNVVPFFVCPCCILPSASSFWQRRDFGEWIKHLKGLAAETHDVVEVVLTIAGRNLVLAGKPKSRPSKVARE